MDPGIIPRNTSQTVPVVPFDDFDIEGPSLTFCETCKIFRCCARIVLQKLHCITRGAERSMFLIFKMVGVVM